jgi:translation initiation factor 2 alpha subunit (eIF-2alpha)
MDGLDLRIFTEKQQATYKEVREVSTRLLQGEKARSIERNLLDSGVNKVKAHKLIVVARKLLQKNLKNLGEQIATVHNERYDELFAMFLEMDMYDNALVSMEQQEMVNGLGTKGSLTIINNNVNADFFFEPSKLNKLEQNELSEITKKIYVLNRAK